jgi:Protein of unknown function (DUF3800)
MFTVYIDDSGTAPEHPVSMASGLIIPAIQIPRLDKEWDGFLKNEAIPSGFHTSECVARNHKSEFASWDDTHVRRVLKRIRQIIFKYSVQAFSMAVCKSDFDAIIPDELRRFSGKHHYSWAVDHAGGFIRRWGEERGVGIEYIFDMAGKNERREIGAVMEHAEALFPGRFVGHYAFRSRIDTPALQCVDLFAWTCYQQALLKFRNRKLSPIAQESWDDFCKNDQWCGAWTALPDQLKDWVNKIYADPKELQRIRGLIT